MQFVPPTLIFPRVRAKLELLSEAPADSVGAYQPSRGMTSKVVLACLQHFNRFVKPSMDSPALLLLDNHCSHIFSLITYARDAQIEMLSFPPHCSHKLQHLDRTVYGPLKCSYNRACDDWRACNPGKPVTEDQVVVGGISVADIRDYTPPPQENEPIFANVVRLSYSPCGYP